MSVLSIEIPEKLEPLLAPSRYKGIYGGRGSGKSHFFAEQLVDKCLDRKIDWVCLREVQKSLDESVKKLLESKIEKFGVGHMFEVQHNRILTPFGGKIVFLGMQDQTAHSIKSLEGYDGAWFEESQAMTARSLEMLRPTIRKEGSELWFSWNPEDENDPIDQFLRGADVPDNSIVIQLNWRDNPWFPDVLNEERRLDFRTAPNRYRHIWEGDYGQDGEPYFPISLFLDEGKPVDVTWRCDQIFATMDTSSKDGAEHDGTGVVYWARSKYTGTPLILLDWDVVQIQSDLLTQFVPSVNMRLEELASELKAREGNVGIWIEDKDSGIWLNQAIAKTGIPSHPIDSKMTAAGKEGRAIIASKYIQRGMVRLSSHAFNKTKSYRNQTKNHLVDQVGNFRMGQARKDHRKDLLDATMYGVIIGLGDASGDAEGY